MLPLFQHLASGPEVSFGILNVTKPLSLHGKMLPKWHAVTLWADKRTGGNFGVDTQRQCSETTVQLLALIVLTNDAALQNGTIFFSR